MSPTVLLLSPFGIPDETVAEVRAKRGELVALSVELGAHDAAGRRDRALAAGALRCHVVDARERFAADVALPALRAGLGAAPPTAALAEVAWVLAIAEIARIERTHELAFAASAVDSPRFARLLAGAAPDLSHRIVAAGAAGVLPRDALVTPLGRLVGAGPAPVGRSTEESALVEIRVEAGVPVALNGVEMPPVELFDSLAAIAGAHGVGYVAASANTGGESVFAPAAVVLDQALAAIADDALGAASRRLRTAHREAYGALVLNGGWFGPLRRAVDAYYDTVWADLAAHVRIRLARGDSQVVACHAASLYDRQQSPVGA
jgi:argininosuccinate synthase